MFNAAAVLLILECVVAPLNVQAEEGYNCSALPEWKRQAYYAEDTYIQYQGTAYVSLATTKRDVPSAGYPWSLLDRCATEDGGGGSGSGGDPSPISIFGAWHCGDDYCTWSEAPDMVEFDKANHWLIDRGDGSGLPSVNLVILSFVHPLTLLDETTPRAGGFGCDPCGIPVGMTAEVVNYFKAHDIRVMLSIGGITYTEAWSQALAKDPVQLGLNAAAVAQELGVGIEIDYEENRNPDLDGLEAFIFAYRTVLPFVAEPKEDGSEDANRLTIDLAAGDRWLIAITERATRDWLNTDYSEEELALRRKLDYANAMVTPRQPSADSAIANWQEHVDGKSQYDPPIPPLAPAKFTGSLWLTGRKPIPECVDFDRSLQKATGDFVQTVSPSSDHPDYAHLSNGMLGFMFWAAGCEGTRSKCTTPEFQNSCEGGMGVAAGFFDIPIPMEPLRPY